jgi:hypothetical protein
MARRRDPSARLLHRGWPVVLPIAALVRDELAVADQLLRMLEVRSTFALLLMAWQRRRARFLCLFVVCQRIVGA